MKRGAEDSQVTSATITGKAAAAILWPGEGEGLQPPASPHSTRITGKGQLRGLEKCLHHLGANESVLAAAIHLPTEGHVIPQMTD